MTRLSFQNLLGAALLAQNVLASGGFFGAPETPVSSSGDAIVFGVKGNTVQMQVQIQYQATDEFGWVLPVPAVPTKLEIGSSLLFHALFQETLPTFNLTIENNGQLSQATIGTQQGGIATSTCNASVLEQNCPVQGPTRGGGDGSVTVWADGHAGLLDFSVVEGNKTNLLDWLASNNYTLPDNTTALETVLTHYEEQGHNVYVVMKVAPETPSGAVQPISLEYELPSGELPQVHNVPTMLSSLSATSNRTLQVYFFSSDAESRAIPVNYLDVTLNDAYVDWVGCLEKGSSCYYDDYIRRYAQAISEVENQTLITEYNGPSSIVQDKIAIQVPESIATSENWLAFFKALSDAGVPAIASVQAIIDKYVPPKTFAIDYPFQCVQFEHDYRPNGTSPSMDKCYGIFTPPSDWQWNASGLYAELEEQIFAPARQAQHSIDSTYSSLTRLYGQVQPKTNTEPFFVVTTGKPQVDNIHRATAIPVCDLDLPNALEITLAQQDGSTDMVFWQPAFLTCPTWQKTSPGPVFSRKQAQPRIVTMAQQFMAWGVGNDNGVDVQPNANGQFMPQDIQNALDHGHNLLFNLTTPAVTDANGMGTGGGNKADNGGAGSAGDGTTGDASGSLKHGSTLCKIAVSAAVVLQLTF